VVATAVGLLLALPAAAAAVAIWQARVAIRQSEQALCPIVALTLTSPRPAHLTHEQAQGYADMEALSREYGCGL
jgi:hypothetical protein